VRLCIAFCTADKQPRSLADGDDEQNEEKFGFSRARQWLATRAEIGVTCSLQRIVARNGIVQSSSSIRNNWL